MLGRVDTRLHRDITAAMESGITGGTMISGPHGKSAFTLHVLFDII